MKIISFVNIYDIGDIESNTTNENISDIIKELPRVVIYNKVVYRLNLKNLEKYSEFGKEYENVFKITYVSKLNQVLEITEDEKDENLLLIDDMNEKMENESNGYVILDTCEQDELTIGPMICRADQIKEVVNRINYVFEERNVKIYKQ